MRVRLRLRLRVMGRVRVRARARARARARVMGRVRVSSVVVLPSAKGSVTKLVLGFMSSKHLRLP